MQLQNGSLDPGSGIPTVPRARPLRNRLAPLVRCRPLFADERPKLIHHHFREFQVVHQHVADRFSVVADSSNPLRNRLVVMRGALWALLFGSVNFRVA